MTAAFWNQQIRDNELFLLSAAWPIGSIFTAAVSTNPNTLLGYGTWAAYGAGRVLVGIDAGQTEFDTLDETGGAKTVTLTVGEIPAHHHTYSQTNWGAHASTGSTEAGDFSSPVVNTGDTGGGGAHNNLQPYIVVYRWKRTA